MTIPIREFACLVDPDCLPFLLGSDGAGILSLQLDLQDATPPVDVNLVFPAFLAERGVGALSAAHSLFKIADMLPNVPTFEPAPHLPLVVKDAFSDQSEAVKRALSLLTLSEAWQVDWLLTNHPVLLDTREPP